MKDLDLKHTWWLFLLIFLAMLTITVGLPQLRYTLIKNEQAKQDYELKQWALGQVGQCFADKDREYWDDVVIFRVLEVGDQHFRVCYFKKGQPCNVDSSYSESFHYVKEYDRPVTCN